MKMFNTFNKSIREYFKLKVSGFRGIVLQAGGEKEALEMGKLFEENKHDIIANIHILTNDSIYNIFSKESEEFKRGLRSFGEIYIDFLSACERFKLERNESNMVDKLKKKIENDMINTGYTNC